MKLTQKTIRAATISYNPKTGRFSKIFEGQRIDLIPRQKLCLGVVGGNHSAIKVAWVFMRGAIPAGKTVVQINWDRFDFRWDNLALAGPSQLRAARKPWSRNGKGVYFDPSGHLKPWRAQIYRPGKGGEKGKNISLGRFASKPEATAAFEVEYQKTWGKFARLS